MSSAPMTIPAALASAPASAASSPSSGLYVPVHRRTGSSTSSRSSSSTRSEASSSSFSSSGSERATSQAPEHPLIYSRTALMSLMQSPLARLSLDTRESLRTAFPELVTNRKQRKALEYHSQAHVKAQSQSQAQPPLVRVQPRRNRPAGRAPERRRNATKVVDDASWRGRRVVAVPIAV